ncbi:hypothetical protein F4820DRAFT_449652 [Hypoxylon rubiginosum]|uniref:Uncharacterized protein n=1 Tax=Hypoxylon rubiginosum TaxID=110542 RepID=A0ACB9YXX4_9PEZI|nr:hypothetical protein F4820DRAFT_449652 [Hypoxylon rubiginosum]
MSHPHTTHRPCTCAYCRCRNFAQEPDSYYYHVNGTSPTAVVCSTEPTPTLCLICERAELAGKNAPTYDGCRCTCKCKLQREDGSPLCGDCGEQDRLRNRRHRAHGFATAAAAAAAAAKTRRR